MSYRLFIGVLYFGRIQQLSLGCPLNIRLEKFLFFLKTHIPPIPAIMIPGYGLKSAMDIFRYQCADICRMISCCFADFLGAGSVRSHGEGFELILDLFILVFCPRLFNFFLLLCCNLVFCCHFHHLPVLYHQLPLILKLLIEV